MYIKRSLSFILATAVAAAFVAAGGSARAAGSAPALAAFDTMFAGINDYTYTLKSHEVKGSATQDRTYSYQFLKPHYVKTLILEGDGKGGGGVWTGGTQVSGHQGGILSAIHLKVDLHDPKAVSLLGYTIPDGLIPSDARVEMDAKKAAGYFTSDMPAAEDLTLPKGRALDE